MTDTKNIISSKQKLEYLMNGGNYCPLCGSENISGGPIHVASGTCVQSMDCGDCGGEWADGYKLEAVHQD